MDFLPPSRYRLSLSPNVYYTQGVGRLQGGGSRQGRYSTWNTFVHHPRPFLSCFFSVSSLLFIPFATYRVWSLTGWIAELLDWRTLNENVSGSFERPVLSLVASTGLLLFRETSFCASANCFPWRFVSFLAEGFLFRVIVPSEYSRLPSVSAGSTMIVSIWNRTREW